MYRYSRYQPTELKKKSIYLIVFTKSSPFYRTLPRVPASPDNKIAILRHKRLENTKRKTKMCPPTFRLPCSIPGSMIANSCLDIVPLALLQTLYRKLGAVRFVCRHSPVLQGVDALLVRQLCVIEQAESQWRQIWHPLGGRFGTEFGAGRRYMGEAWKGLVRLYDERLCPQCQIIHEVKVSYVSEAVHHYSGAFRIGRTLNK